MRGSNRFFLHVPASRNHLRVLDGYPERRVYRVSDGTVSRVR